MDKVDLSVLVPARNEEFLGRTIQDILENSEANTEIIAILDGYLPNPPLPISDRVTVIYNPVSVGQRAGTNQAAKIAKGKYLMKADAHLAFDKGFDRKMLEAFKETGDNVTMIPVMRNLHVFDWVCEDGHRRYQGPSGPCEECGKPTVKDVVWIPKKSPTTHSFRFDKTMHFQYHGDWSKTKLAQLGVIVGYKLSFDTRTIPFGIIELFTKFAGSHQLSCLTNLSWFGKNVSSDTASLSSIDRSGSVRADEISIVGDKTQVEGITTTSIITDMVDDGDIPSSPLGDGSGKQSISESMCKCFLSEIGATTVSTPIGSTNPIPTTGSIIESELIEKINNILGGKFVYNEKTSSYHNGSVILETVHVKDLRETMSIQGSCFMLTKEKWFELDICSEEFNSWGQQGVEVACKTWLSGGSVIVNMKTWYAHMFRTRGADFGFPYPNPQDKVNENRELSRQLFQRDGWSKATRKFQWILDKFNPPDWEMNTKGIIYYTHNQLDEKIAKPVRDKLLKISQDKNIPIVSSSLKKMDFGIKNIHFPSLKRSYYAIFKQILGALENSSAEIIFFTEHDVLYHPTHFDFMPLNKETFYYNQNVWYLRQDGHGMHYDVNQLSGLCVYRETAITHFRERLKRLETEEFTRNMGFEPFTHNRVKWENNFKMDTWKSEYPNIDIRFGINSTGMRWKKEEYRNQQLLINWIEAEEIPGWGKGVDIVSLIA